MTQRVPSVDDDTIARANEIMELMREVSTARYRGLVYDDPDFVECFMHVTPVDQISQLQLGSRPARRATGIACST